MAYSMAMDSIDTRAELSARINELASYLCAVAPSSERFNQIEIERMRDRCRDQVPMIMGDLSTHFQRLEGPFSQRYILNRLFKRFMTLHSRRARSRTNWVLR